MDKRPIGIFDSGVGGITVLKEIKEKLPKENIIYLGDTKNFPYGNKSKEDITVKYIKNQKFDKVGVIATEGTIKNGAWERKLKDQIPNIQVVNKACPMLATIAEEGKAKSRKGRSVIKEYMKPFKEQKINKIILGCTHFPIYEQIIREELEYNVELINTGKFISLELEQILKKNNLENDNFNKGNIIIDLTKQEEQFNVIAQNILDFK